VLKRMGCDRGQGFLLGRPMDIEKTREALARDNTTRAAG
jgi:EAL domain-containing protein (putative c-di-GMP-specific phosphodiesterase class I)